MNAKASDPAHTVTPAARRRALLLLAVLTLVWGTNWVLFPMVLREISVWDFRIVSTVCASAMLLGIARWRGQSLVIPPAHRKTVVAAALTYLVVWNIASAVSAKLIPSGQAAVLGFTMPLWAALIGWLFLGQRLGARLIMAVVLGALAVVLLAWRSLGVYAEAPLGVGLGLLAALGWAVGTLILKRSGVQSEVPAAVLTGWQLLATLPPIVLGALLFGHAPEGAGPDGPSLQAWLLVAYITLLPMGLGYLTWFTIVGLLPATVAGLSSIMVPVVAMITGALVHGEPLGPAQLAAMLCCAGALWLALTAPPPVPQGGSPAEPAIPPVPPKA